MKIHVELDTQCAEEPLRIGNVYHVKGGHGSSVGHMQICIAITEPKPCVGRWALMLVVDKEGNPVNVTRYGIHVFEDRQPMAFVDGFENLEFVMRSL